MTPSLPRRPYSLVAATFFALSLLAGCEKSGDEEDVTPPTHHAAATPTPAPVAQSSDRACRKALSAYNAVSNYLKAEDPNLREHLQKAASKFVDDKDKWRERLAKRQHELQPKIARLREQLTKAEGQSAEALRNLRQQLATLETERADAEHKLSELESVTTDAWNSVRDGLAGNDASPASPAPGRR